MKKVVPALVVFFGFFLFSQVALASTLYLTPASLTVGQGSVFYIQLRLNTGGVPVNGVTAVLQYPADKLSVASVSYESTAFGVEAEETKNAGSLKLSRGSIEAVTGVVNVATVGFRATQLGTAQPVFTDGSAVPKAADSTDSLVLSQSAGGTYKIVPPSELPSLTPGPGLQISDLQVTDIASNSATVTWTTDGKSDSTVEYGLVANQYFVTASLPDLTTSHSVPLSGSVLYPGAKFHYHVISKTPDGSVGTSPDEVFQLTGSLVVIKVVDTRGQPLAKVSVGLASYQQSGAPTDSGGIVAFDNVIPGSYTVIVKSQGMESSSPITVKYDPQPQLYVVTADFQGFSLSKTVLTDWLKNIGGPTVLAAAGLLAPIIVGLVLLLWSRVKRATMGRSW